MSIKNKCYQTEDGPIWHSRSVAVVAVVIFEVDKKNYVLLTKRSDTMEDKPGEWCLPCGYLDWDENIEEATIREVLEETNLNLKENEHISINSFRIDSKPKSKQNVSISSAFFSSLKKLPELKITPEIAIEVSELEWCEINSINKELAFNHLFIINYAISELYNQGYIS